MSKGQYRSKSVSTTGQTATPAGGKSDRAPLKTTINNEDEDEDGVYDDDDADDDGNKPEKEKSEVS